MNTLYIITSPSGKVYVGVTAQLLRKRIAQHKKANSPFGKSLRKYPKESFRYRLFKFDTLEEAYEVESKLIGPREVSSSWYYNQCEGGKGGHLGGCTSPMLRREIAERRSSLMKTEFNPMTKEDIRLKHKEAVNSKEYKDLMSKIKEESIGKRTRVRGTIYPSVRKAAEACGMTPSGLKWRIKSPNYPEYNIIDVT